MFWRRTPRRIVATLKANEDRLVREHNERMSLAWHIEALHRAKRIPKLNTMLVKSKRRKRQTWQEQMAIMGMWATALNRFNAQKNQKQELNKSKGN